MAQLLDTTANRALRCYEELVSERFVRDVIERHGNWIPSLLSLLLSDESIERRPCRKFMVHSRDNVTRSASCSKLCAYASTAKGNRRPKPSFAQLLSASRVRHDVNWALLIELVELG